MRKKILLATVPLLGFALLLAGILLHKPPAVDKAPSPRVRGDRTDTYRAPNTIAMERPAHETAQCMDEAAVRGLVQDLKLASLRNDRWTQRGLVVGLKTHGAVARRIIEQERSAADDGRIIAALDAALKELP